MLIYHGCSDARRETILANGIEPRGDRPSMWQGLPSHPEMVYLTDTYPFFFTNTGGTPWVVVFEIDTDRLDLGRFYPDEDYLAQIANEISVVPQEGQSLHEAMMARMIDFRERWQESLDRLGTCCHRGVVPREAVKRYCRFNRSLYLPLAMLLASPVIGIDEHATQRDFYQRLLKLMFGDCDQLPETWQQKCEERLAAPGLEVVAI